MGNPGARDCPLADFSMGNVAALYVGPSSLQLKVPRSQSITLLIRIAPRQGRQTKFFQKSVMPCRCLTDLALYPDEFGMRSRQVNLRLRLSRADITGDVQVVIVLRGDCL